MSRADKFKLQVLGAAARLDMLRAEMAVLHREFPALRPVSAPVIHPSDRKHIDKRMKRVFKKRRKLSAATRAKMSAAAKARHQANKANKTR